MDKVSQGVDAVVYANPAPVAEYGVPREQITRRMIDHYTRSGPMRCLLANPYTQSLLPAQLTWPLGSEMMLSVEGRPAQTMTEVLGGQPAIDQVHAFDATSTVCIMYKKQLEQRDRDPGIAFRDGATHTRVRVGKVLVMEASIISPSMPHAPNQSLEPLATDLGESATRYVNEHIRWFRASQVSKAMREREAALRAGFQVPMYVQPPAPAAPRVCAVCGEPGNKRCSKCNRVTYCSQDCQKKHWRVHKTECA